MKKIITILILLYSFAINAQDCKYKTNEVDKFTGKFTKLTKPVKVISTFFTVGDFSVKKVDTSFYFIFDYTLSSYSNFSPYSVNPGAQLIFLLENGDIVTLKTKDAIKGVKHTVIGLPPVYVCELANVSYPVSKTDIDKFFQSKIKSIRFYRTEDNGKEDYVDNEIKNRKQDDIQELIKCVY